MVKIIAHLCDLKIDGHRMETKEQKLETKKTKGGTEKPFSLWGAPFTEVLGALLKTKSMPKGASKGKEKSKG